MGSISSTFLSQKEEFEKGKELYESIFPFNNSLVESYCQTYQLNAKDVNDLYHCFSKMDRKNEGYIEITNILDFLQETHFSIIYPYLKGTSIFSNLLGLFKLVEKKEESRIDFFEWLSLTIEYCVMTEDQLIKLIFRIIDKNSDEIISKKEILNFYSQVINSISTRKAKA